MHNKSMLDFKQRIQKQQKREHEQHLKEQRKKEESELNLLKVKQQEDQQQFKKQYYADLDMQKFLKTYKDKTSRMLTKDELGINKTHGLNAMIPGINNWSTVGSAPTKRGYHSVERKQIPSDAHLVMAPVSLPNIPSARNSKYKIMKDLEKEYFETADTSNAFSKRRLSYNTSSPVNLQNMNSYIGKEQNAVVNQMKNKSDRLRY